MRTENWKKIVKKIISAFWILFTAAVLLVLLNVATAKFNQQVPQIGGYSIFRITSGSMEPTIPTGTYILVKDVEAKEIQKGDIITFYSTDPTIRGLPNTHRVISKPLRTSKGLIFQTRGDANYVNDNYFVAESRLIGRYCCNLTRLTKLVNFFMTRSMLTVLLIVQAVSLLLMGLSVKILSNSKKEREELKNKTSQQREEEIKKQAIEEYLRSQSLKQEETEKEEKKV